MKKLIITRILAFFVFYIVHLTVELIMYSCGIDIFDEAIGNWISEVTASAGIIGICVLYFFAGKKFHDVSIKKLLLVFFIWTAVAFAATIFIHKYMFYLGAGYVCFPSYIHRLGLTKDYFLSGIIGFFTEMTVIIMGIFIGRINAGKTDGKHVIYLSKFCGIILAYVISCMLIGLFIATSPRAPMGYLTREGQIFGWAVSMLPVALWSIYAGFKSFRTNLKITLPIFLLWNAFTVLLNSAFGLWDFLKLGGIFRAFSMGLIVMTDGKYKWFVYIVAYLLEALLITAGVFLGRYFNKRKALKGENPREITVE